MPGKSQRRRGKRKKGRRGSLAIAAKQQPVSHPAVSIPSAGVPTPMAMPTATRYPYIAVELRRIAILAGIMMAILVVLALVLS